MGSGGKLLWVAMGLALCTPCVWAQEDDAAPATKPAASAPAAAYESDPAFVKAVEAALAPDIDAKERLTRWQAANALAGGRCMRCFRGAVDSEFNQHLRKDAAATSTQMEAVAVDPDDKFYAEASLGRAMMHGDGVRRR